MAFSKNNMTSLGGNAGKSINHYAFYNEDGDTVTDAGYFAWDRLRKYDQIVSISANGATRVQYYVSAVASEKATAVASS